MCAGVPWRGISGLLAERLWKTTDGGETWEPVTDGQIHSASVGAVAVSESNPDIVYIGMGEACIRGNIMAGDGVYKSTDAGKTWTHVGFGADSKQTIAKIRIDPRNPDVVYAAVFGNYGAPNDERGIYKTTDGGKTWRRVLFRDNKTGGVDISIDPGNPDVIYAALWEAYRKEYTMSSGGPGSGLFKSTDAGEHWTEITRNPGLPSGVVGKIGVSVSGADSNRVYAIVENDNGGLFRSDDAGKTWSLINSGRNIRQRAFYYSHVTADPVHRDIVYVQNVGTFKSVDGGKTLESFAGGDSHDLWIDPENTQHILHASDGGGAVTYNADAQQRTWSSRAYPTGQFYHVITTEHVPYHVCGAQQDASTVCVPSEAGFGGRGGGRGGRGGGAPQTYSAGGSEPGYIAPDPKDIDVFFAGANNGGFLTRINRHTGEYREVGPYPRMFSGEPSSALRERWQWTYPIVFSPVDPHRAVHLVPARLEDHQRRAELGADQWGPYPARFVDDGSVRRTDHPRHERAGGVRGRVRAGAGQAERERALGRVGRWADSGDPERRRHLDQRDTEGHARLRSGEHHRCLGVRRRDRVRGREAPAPRRRVAVHLPHPRLRTDLDEDRERHRA